MSGEKMPSRRPSRLELAGAAAAILGTEACATGSELNRPAADVSHQEQGLSHRQLSPESAHAAREALRVWGEDPAGICDGISMLIFRLVEPGHEPTYYMTVRPANASESDHHRLINVLRAIKHSIAILNGRLQDGISRLHEDNTVEYLERLSRDVDEIKALSSSDAAALTEAISTSTHEGVGDIPALSPSMVEILTRNLLPENHTSVDAPADRDATENMSTGHRIPTTTTSHHGRHHRHHNP